MRSNIDTYYNKEFADSPLLNKKWPELFYPVIMKEFNPKSIIDIGCGTADILEPFERYGITIQGVDGSKACKENSKIKQSNYILHDLRDKITAADYDLCFCLEVAEHIEEEYSDILIDNLTSHSKNILFTAAPPGQGGMNHINCKPREWWINKFKNKGYTIDIEVTERIKNELRNIPGVEWYYINNLMLFRKIGKIVCIGIITYCHNDDVIRKTQECFASILMNTDLYAPNCYQVIFVDNGSNDKFKAWLKQLEESHLKVHTIYNKENLMFAKAANQAMEYASRFADYCVILNNDTIPKLGWLFSLMQAAETDPKIAVVGAKILQPGTDLVYHTGTILKNGAIKDPYGQCIPKQMIPRKLIEDRLWVNGSCMLIKTSIIKEFGYFDDKNFTLYFEEADYMIRLHQAGYRVVYCPMAEIEHYQKTTADTIPTAKDNFYGNWRKLESMYSNYWKSNHLEGCPKIAIVLPIYNAEKTIKTTLDSLFKQSYVNWEVFAIDNMSTDLSISILKDYKKLDDNSKGLIGDKNDRVNIGTCIEKGVAFARNEAIKQIVKKGGFKYVFFLDADDIWYKDYLEKVIYQFEKYGFDMIFSLCDKRFDDGSTAVPYGIPEPTVFDKELLYKQNYIFNSFVGVKLDTLLKAGEFNNEYNGVEDWHMWCKIAKSGANIYCYPEACGIYHVAKNGNTNAADGNKEKRDLIIKENEN